METLPRDVITDSNMFISDPILSKKVSAIVIIEYIIYIYAASRLGLGILCDKFISGDSVIEIWRLPEPTIGKIVTINTNIPVAPIQCDNAFQSKRDLGIADSHILLIPVVVYPATDSKNASMK